MFASVGVGVASYLFLFIKSWFLFLFSELSHD